MLKFRQNTTLAFISMNLLYTMAFFCNQMQFKIQQITVLLLPFYLRSEKKKNTHENDNRNKRVRIQIQDSHNSKAPSDQTDPHGFSTFIWTD